MLDKVAVEHGGTLHDAKNGTAALELAASQPYDVAIVSMQLSDMDGIELTRRLRQTPAHKFIPILVLSSSISKELGQKAELTGVTELFRKQDIVELAQYLHRFLIRFKPLQGKVLYVEDNLSQQMAMRGQLVGWGLHVDSFSNADEAWPTFLDGKYDLVITDIVLDGNMSGTRFVNRIRRQGGNLGDTPILALTAFDTAARRIQLFHLGVSDYVAKPTIPEELYSRINSLISSKRIVEREQQLSLALQQVEQANNAKSKFLSTMSHELRTPMNAILGYAQILAHDAHDSEHKDYAHNIVMAGEHLLHLINETLDLAKIEAGYTDISLESVAADPIVNDCITLVRPLAGKNQVSLAYEGLEGAIAKADRKRLKQVLLNLMSNAIKYNRTGGSVTIKTEATGDRLLRISVTDTGLGIPPEQLAELFEPFKRLGAERTGIEGTGIGLAISRQIVNLMGGSLNVSSEVGVGSTFWLELPQA